MSVCRIWTGATGGALGSLEVVSGAGLPAGRQRVRLANLDRPRARARWIQDCWRRPRVLVVFILSARAVFDSIRFDPRRRCDRASSHGEGVRPCGYFSFSFTFLPRRGPGCTSASSRARRTNLRALRSARRATQWTDELPVRWLLADVRESSRTCRASP